jgi:hypothetical protein
VRQILVNDTVLNINVGAGGGVCRGALVHTKPFAGRCLLLCLTAISSDLLSTVISTRYISGFRKDNPNVFNSLMQNRLHF